MATTTHTISIYPYPLTGLVVQHNLIDMTITDCGDHYEVTDVISGIDVKISADGYNTLIIPAETTSINIGNWYAWTSYVDRYTEGSTTVTWYTLSATPSVNDNVYTTPPYLTSVVTSNTPIYGDIDTYKLTQGTTITAITDTTIKIGGIIK